MPEDALTNMSGTWQRMARTAIYGFAAVEIGTLLFFLAMDSLEPASTSGSGGREMGTFFNLLILTALVPAAFLFHFAKGRVLRLIAASVVMAPVIIVAYVALRWAVPPIVIAPVLGLLWWGLSRVRRKDATCKPLPDTTINRSRDKS